MSSDAYESVAGSVQPNSEKGLGQSVSDTVGGNDKTQGDSLAKQAMDVSDSFKPKISGADDMDRPLDLMATSECARLVLRISLISCCSGLLFHNCNRQQLMPSTLSPEATPTLPSKRFGLIRATSHGQYLY